MKDGCKEPNLNAVGSSSNPVQGAGEQDGRRCHSRLIYFGEGICRGGIGRIRVGSIEFGEEGSIEAAVHPQESSRGRWWQAWVAAVCPLESHLQACSSQKAMKSIFEDCHSYKYSGISSILLRTAFESAWPRASDAPEPCSKDWGRAACLRSRRGCLEGLLEASGLSRRGCVQVQLLRAVGEIGRAPDLAHFHDLQDSVTITSLILQN